MKKIGSVLIALALVGSIVLSAFASSNTEFVQKSSFWNWLNNQGGILSGIVAYGLGRACPNSDDGYHRSSSYSCTNVFGEYVCECDSCGHKFVAYESDLKQSYQQQVESLPAPGIGSDGALYITVTGALGVWSSSFANSVYFYGCPHFLYGTGWTQETSNNPQYSRDFDCDNNAVTLRLKSGYSGFACQGFGYCWSFLAPIDGMYVQIASQQCTGNYILSDGANVPFSVGYDTQYYKPIFYAEQYKDDQGTGPPGGSGDKEDKETIWDKIANFFGSIVDGIAGIFEAILGKLLDALTALSELLMDKVKDVVEVVLSVFDELPQLFGGFLDFLGVVFPFLPSEITLLLTFGVIAVVFIGIIKAIRR